MLCSATSISVTKNNCSAPFYFLHRYVSFSWYVSCISFVIFYEKLSMTEVACDGTETSLTECRFDSPKKTYSHFKDAGVRCNYPIPQSQKVSLFQAAGPLVPLRTLDYWILFVKGHARIFYELHLRPEKS